MRVYLLHEGSYSSRVLRGVFGSAKKAKAVPHDGHEAVWYAVGRLDSEVPIEACTGYTMLGPLEWGGGPYRSNCDIDIETWEVSRGR